MILLSDEISLCMLPNWLLRIPSSVRMVSICLVWLAADEGKLVGGAAGWATVGVGEPEFGNVKDTGGLGCGAAAAQGWATEGVREGVDDTGGCGPAADGKYWDMSWVFIPNSILTCDLCFC